jgi:hypothetical protein
MIRYIEKKNNTGTTFVEAIFACYVFKPVILVREQRDDVEQEAAKRENKHNVPMIAGWIANSIQTVIRN